MYWKLRPKLISLSFVSFGFVSNDFLENERNGRYVWPEFDRQLNS